MALDTTDPATPLGSSALSGGDNEIRQLKQDVVDSIVPEHTLAGEHIIRAGTTGDHPAAASTASRVQIFVNNGVGGPFFEYYDTITTSWVKLSDIATLLAHINSTDLTGANGHVTASVKTPNIADAAITGPKLGAGSVGVTNITGGTANSLVAAGNASALHIHDIGELTDTGGLLVPLVTNNIGTTYTPTVTGLSSSTQVTTHLTMYTQVGSIVTVTGTVTVNYTSTVPTTTTWRLSPPVARAFTAQEQVVGTAFEEDAFGLADIAHRVKTLSGLDSIDFSLRTDGSAIGNVHYTYTYLAT